MRHFEHVIKILALCLFMAFATVITASANVIHVPGDQPTIQGALNSASYGDTVMVAAGTYHENIIWPEVNGIKLLGEDRDNTIIDGSNVASVLRFESIDIITNATVVDGFTITNGNALPPWPASEGGGIFVYSSDPILRNLNIIGNTADDFGGGMYIWLARPIIMNVLIADNTALSHGGAESSLASPQFINVTFSDNVDGGFYHSGSGLPVLENCVVAGNSLYGIRVQGDSFQPGRIAVAYSNTYDQVQLIGNASIEWREGNIDTDPFYRDPDNGDYHLQDSEECGDTLYSPCIDAGDPVYIDAVHACDAGLGEPRSDMGAYGGHIGVPQIGNIVNVPQEPDNMEEVEVSAVITDPDGSVDRADLHVYNGSTPLTINMNNIADSFFATVPGQPYGTTVWYYITAVDNMGYASMSDTLSYHVMDAPCAVVEMEPDSYPINVHPGGSFGFTGTVGNPRDTAIVTDVWVNVRYQEFAFPVGQFLNIRIPPGQYFDTHLIQQVPQSAQPGSYEYIAYCGDYHGWSVCDFASFDFTVTQSVLANGAHDWNLKGGWDGNSTIPVASGILENYPNPFNVRTNIIFDLGQSGQVNLCVYNLVGQKVATLVDEFKNSGRHEVSWDASDYSSGIYFYRLTAGGKVFTQRMTLLK
jgi:hypothetical protein